MLELTGCKLSIDKRWRKGTASSDFNDREEHYLIVEIPLPGGKAVYEYQITKDQYDNMTTAHKLAQVGK